MTKADSLAPGLIRVEHAWSQSLKSSQQQDM